MADIGADTEKTEDGLARSQQSGPGMDIKEGSEADLKWTSKLAAKRT